MTDLEATLERFENLATECEMIGKLALDGGYIALSVGARSLLTGGALIWVNRVAGVILIGASIWLATLTRS